VLRVQSSLAMFTCQASRGASRHSDSGSVTATNSPCGCASR
jgi:hypothetical protein